VATVETVGYMTQECVCLEPWKTGPAPRVARLGWTRSALTSLTLRFTLAVDPLFAVAGAHQGVSLVHFLPSLVQLVREAVF